MRLGEPTISPGTISGDVKDVQMILTGQGYNVGPIDGHYGGKTQTAVQAFQRSKGLVPDGIVGPMTWAALRGMSALSPTVPVVPAPPVSVKPAPKPVSTTVGMLPVVGLALLGLAVTFMQSGRR